MHHILQLHELHQTFFRIDVNRLIERIIAGKESGGTGEDKVIALQQRLRVVGRHIVGEIAVNMMIIFKKIISLRRRGEHRYQQEAE